MNEDLIIPLTVHQDHRGKLVALEHLKSVPFETKRVYYLYDLAANEARGFHAHKNLKQMMICLSGSCCVILDNSRSKKSYFLSSPSQALLIDRMIWHEMREFSKNCLLLVLASAVYDEADYIRDYSEFLVACSNAQDADLEE